MTSNVFYFHLKAAEVADIAEYYVFNNVGTNFAFICVSTSWNHK